MKNLALVTFAAIVLAAWSLPADAQVSFDGKATSFHTATAVALTGVPVLIGTIAKGKKKQILEINAMITSEGLAPGAPWTLNTYIDVNGVSADPTLATAPSGAVQDCGSDTAGGPYSQPVEGCTVSGTWLLDLDAAELANPGVFVNQPLTVTMYGGVGGNPFILGIPASASLSVKMLKKK